jgi:hypothetical protein
MMYKMMKRLLMEIRVNRLEGSRQLALRIGKEHAWNYVYVERKDDKMVRIENHIIWRSRY